MPPGAGTCRDACKKVVLRRQRPRQLRRFFIRDAHGSPSVRHCRNTGEGAGTQIVKRIHWAYRPLSAVDRAAGRTDLDRSVLGIRDRSGMRDAPAHCRKHACAAPTDHGTLSGAFRLRLRSCSAYCLCGCRCADAPGPCPSDPRRRLFAGLAMRLFAQPTPMPAPTQLTTPTITSHADSDRRADPTDENSVEPPLSLRFRSS